MNRLSVPGDDVFVRLLGLWVEETLRTTYLGETAFPGTTYLGDLPLEVRHTWGIPGD